MPRERGNSKTRFCAPCNVVSVVTKTFGRGYTLAGGAMRAAGSKHRTGDGICKLVQGWDIRGAHKEGLR